MESSVLSGTFRAPSAPGVLAPRTPAQTEVHLQTGLGEQTLPHARPVARPNRAAQLGADVMLVGAALCAAAWSLSVFLD